MVGSNIRWALGLSTAVALFFKPCLAQYPEMIPGSHLDEGTGINFTTWTAGEGGFTFGMVLPEDAGEKDVTEYIGYLNCASTSEERTGWCGLSQGGHMIQNLLLVLWPHSSEVLTSFRWATDYFEPAPYTSPSPILTPISSFVNTSGYELIYRCEKCFSWTDGEGYSESVGTSSGELVLGYALAADGPGNAGDPERITLQYHTLGYSRWTAAVGDLVREGYSEWTELAQDAAES